RPAAAELERALGMARQRLATLRTTPGRWQRIAEAEHAVGRSLLDLGRTQEAEAPLVESFEPLTRVYGPASHRTREAAARVAAMYARCGKPDAAARYRALATAPASRRAT